MTESETKPSSTCDLKSFKFLDFFKFGGNPRHITGYQASVTGVIGTIILLLIVGGYIINSTVRFFTAPPQTSVTQNPTLNQVHPFVYTCISVPKLNDPRYFYRAINRITLDVNASKSMTPINLTTPDINTVCIDSAADPNAYLRGYCRPGDCDFLRFKLWNCGCPDVNNPERNRTDCASLSEIGAILDQNYVDVSYDTDIAVVAQHTSPKLEASAVYITTFALNRTQINPDLVRSFETHYKNNLIFSRDSYHLQYFFPDKPFKEVLELQMAMSSHILITVENRQTALDIIGSWGAFFSVIASAGALVFGRYNEKKFYEKNPKWERIDENFRVEEGSDATLQNEAAKLLAGEASSTNLYFSGANNGNNNNLQGGFGRASNATGRVVGGSVEERQVNFSPHATYGGVLT